MTGLLIDSSARRRLGFVAIGIAILVVGFAQLREAPVDVYPEYERTRVVIQTEAVGLSAAEVERLVAVPLEEVLASIPLLAEMRSQSVPGLSMIELIFEDGTDDLTARQLVQEPLSTAYTLPNVTKSPVMLQPLSSTNRVMAIALTSEDLSLIEMSVLARWNMTPKLLGVPGVANVAVWGNRERQLQVQADPQLLAAQGVSLDQVISTTGDSLWVSSLSFLRASAPGAGGWIDTPTQRLGIRHVLPISTPDDLANVAVDGTALRLGDIADIVEGHPPVIGDAFVGDTPALLLVIEKFPGADPVEVTKAVEAAIEDLRPGLSGMHIDTSVFRAASFIESALDNAAVAGAFAAILAAAALTALLLDWRVAVAGLTSIAVALGGAALVLVWFGMTLNLLVAAGLTVAATAILVDAVLVSHGMAHGLRAQRATGLGELSRAELTDLARRRSLKGYSRLRKDELVDLLREPQGSTEAAVLEGVESTRRPVVYGSLVGVLAVLPVFFVTGEAGSFYRPFAWAYVVGVGFSLVVSATFTPALVLLLATRNRERREPQALAGPRDAYSRLVISLLRRRLPGLTVGAALVIGAVGVVASSDVFVDLPVLEERDTRIELEAAPGTSPSAMAGLMGDLSDELQSLAGVGDVAGQVGRAETGDQIVATNSGQMWVRIDSQADYTATVAAIRAAVARHPELRGAVVPYLTGRGLESSGAGTNDVTVRIYGPELPTLEILAAQVADSISGVAGLERVRVDAPAVEPQVEIEVDLEAAQAHGVKPGDVRRAAATVFAGIPVGSLFEEQKVFEVSVWSKPEARGSVDTLLAVLVDKPDGTQVRLDDLADVRMVTIPTLIKHDAASAYLDVVADVDGRSLEAIELDVLAGLAEIDFPREYNPQVRALDADQRADRIRSITLWVIASIGIVLLLQMSFDSWRLAAVAMVGLAVAASGAVLVTTQLAEDVTSFGVLAGLLGVLGVATRGVVLMVHSAQRTVDAEAQAEMVAAARAAFTPVVMSLVTVALAAAPLIVLGVAPGLELAYPAASVFLAGLVTTLVAVLVVVPSLALGKRVRPATPDRDGAAT